MYKKIIFILLTFLFMSGSCDLGGKKSSISSKKAQTALTTNNTPANALPPSIPTPIDTTTINLVDTHKDTIKFNNLKFSIISYPLPLLVVQVKSVKIRTTDAALKVANITDLRDAKNMTEKDKLKELIKSLTFTIEAKDVYDNSNAKIIGDYENLKIIYDGLSNNVDNPNLKPKLNIDGRDVEFNKGYKLIQTGSIFVRTIEKNSTYTGIYVDNNNKPAMISFLGDILNINGIDNFKKHIP